MGVQETQEVEKINLKKIQSRPCNISSLKKNQMNKKEESNDRVAKFNSTSSEAKNQQKQNEKTDLPTNVIVTEEDKNSFENVKIRVRQLKKTGMNKVNPQIQTQIAEVQSIKKVKVDI